MIGIYRMLLFCSKWLFSICKFDIFLLMLELYHLEEKNIEFLYVFMYAWKIICLHLIYFQNHFFIFLFNLKFNWMSHLYILTLYWYSIINSAVIKWFDQLIFWIVLRNKDYLQFINSWFLNETNIMEKLPQRNEIMIYC